MVPLFVIRDPIADAQAHAYIRASTPPSGFPASQSVKPRTGYSQSAKPRTGYSQAAKPSPVQPYFSIGEASDRIFSVGEASASGDLSVSPSVTTSEGAPGPDQLLCLGFCRMLIVDTKRGRRSTFNKLPNGMHENDYNVAPYPSFAWRKRAGKVA